MHTQPRITPTVAIIGGGASGALTAFHLRSRSPHLRILVIDPRPELGLGLAYSTPSLRHLLNVPAGKISALPSQPDHFLHWLRAHHDSASTPDTFAPRAVYGRYLRALLAQAPHIEHIQTSVLDLHPSASGVELTLTTGLPIHADATVLATGNFDPAPPPNVAPTAAYCHNGWQPPTYADLPADAPVTLIGTGLTAVDVLQRLRELGHRGPITAISRHAIFPGTHAGYTPLASSAVPEGTPATCMHYVRALRASIAAGAAWRAAVDSLRPVTNALWQALPLAEQRRFRRHLQRRWDVLRHPMAPSVAALLQAERAAGTLRTLQGRVTAIDAHADGARICLQTTHGPAAHLTARVINCTGPAMNYHHVGSPLLTGLFAQGLAVPGPHGGLLTTAHGALLDTQNQPSRMLFTLGPARLGTLLESIAIPELRSQAVALASLLAALVHPAEDAGRPSGIHAAA